jgi:pyruvate dehydrogenase E2 component (dihydrolipoamide acetyltransferase)
MSREFRMPSLGADMEAGTLVKWQIEPGSPVRRGDVVALVETEKGIIDIESFDDGVVERLLVQPGTRVPVGTALALFEGTETVVAPAPAAPAPQGPPAVDAGRRPAPVRVAKPRASPAARARAAERKLDLAAIAGTGPEGVITLADVERATSRGPADARGSVRNAIAASMSRSKREIPHYYLQLAMNFSSASAWLEEFNGTRPPPERLLPAVLFIKATARAAAKQSSFNGYFGGHGYEPATNVNVGVAIALRGGGLLAPAILDAHEKSLPVLMRELVDLVARARSGHLRSSEVAAATLTITSLGEEGVDALFPIINPPQVAIVGFGSVLQRPWAVGQGIEVRPVITLTLAADHRVTDGRQGAQFLAAIRDGLLQPGEL